MAHKYHSPYILTSAKTGENVEEAFRELGRRIIQHYLDTHPLPKSQAGP